MKDIFLVMASNTKPPDVKYTVLVRLPFPRADFVDPPPVEWDHAKDRELWNALSSTPKGTDIDWQSLATSFQATPAFLVQQAAWLYQRQLAQVREQLRRVNRPSSAASASPMPTGASTLTAGTGLRRPDSSSRAPSSSATRLHENPETRVDAATLETSSLRRGPFLRSTSTNTVTQAQQSTPRTSPSQHRTSNDTERLHDKSTPDDAAKHRRAASPQPVTSDDDSSSTSDHGLKKSRLFSRRPGSRTRGNIRSRNTKYAAGGQGAKPKLRGETAKSDDDDDEPAFLPFSSSSRPTHERPQTAISRGPGERRPSHPTTMSPTARSSDSLSSPEKGLSSDGDGSGVFATVPVDIGSRRSAEREHDQTAQWAGTRQEGRAAPQSNAAGSFRQRNVTSLANRSSSQTQAGHTTTRPSRTPAFSNSRLPSGPASNVGRTPPIESGAHVHSPGGTGTGAGTGTGTGTGNLRWPRPGSGPGPSQGGSDTNTPSMGSSFSDLDAASVTQSALEEALAQEMRAGRGSGHGA